MESFPISNGMTDHDNEKEIELDTDPSDSDDVSFEEEDNETPQSSFGKSKGDKVAELKEKIKKLEAEKQEYLDGWQRTKADFVNLRKRDEEEKKELVKYATEGLIHDLIPVLDSFDMAFANKEAWEKADKNWRVGVEYIYNQLVSTLEKEGLKQIVPLGEKFDPTRDTPAETVPTTNKEEDGKIVAVLQKGYELKGKQVRSPRVKVAEFKETLDTSN